jgi:hypothetical protein
MVCEILRSYGGEYEDDWDVASCSLVEVYRRFRGACPDRADVRGSKHLLNVGKLLPEYMAQHPRRQSSS